LEKKVRFGIVGVGGMGSGHANAMKNVEEVQLMAVSDAARAVCDRVAAEYNVRGFYDYRELIDSGLVDAITVATPHYYHPPVSIYAMRKGIHVLSEKPIAVTVRAADGMIAAAKKGKVKFAVMYQTRSTPEYQAAKRLVSEGKLGDLYRTCCIDAGFRSQAYYDSAAWRGTWKGEGGGVLINQAPHEIDVFMSLGGLPSKVLAATNTRRHRIEVEDEAAALLSYKNGARGYYYTSTTEFPGTSYLELCGDRGKLLLQEGKVRFWAMDKSLQEFNDTATQMWDQPSAREEAVPVEMRESGHGAIIRNLARAILYDEPLLSPGEEGLRSVEFINAVILSGKRGRPVEIPVDRKTYEAFITKMKRSSEPKVVKEAKRITDPRIGKA
jgi:predicted dehydrogenase